MITKRNTLLKIYSANLSGEVSFEVKTEKKVAKIRAEAFFGGKKIYGEDFSPDGKSFKGSFKIDKPKLWTTDEPNLYALSLRMEYADGEEESLFDRFGFRTLSTDGKNVLLNGVPFYVRGYIRGAKAHEHSDNCRLGKREFYRKNIEQAKKYGFNFARFHTTVPDEEFLSVADELGLIVHAELRLPDDAYNNLDEMVFSRKDMVSDEFIKDVSDKFFNHPSFAVYCIGNEIKSLGSSGRVKEIGEFIKKIDPSRLYLDTCAWGENNRPLVDIDVQHLSYFYPYGRHANMYENTDNLLVVGSSGDPVAKDCENSSVTRSLYFSVPLIAHEVCHYTALRDYAGLRKKFKKYGVKEPWWIEEELRIIDEKGYKADFGEMYEASKRFQFEAWKNAFEKMRLSKLIGGFHFLQFADTDSYENSNGIVDCFDDPTFATPEDFKRFNADTVLLCNLAKRNFFCGDELNVRFSLSDFKNGGEEKSDFVYELIGSDGTVYASGSLENVFVGRKGLYEICSVNFRLPKKGGEYVIKASVGNVENKWKIWLCEKNEECDYRDFVSYDKNGVTITDDIEKAFSSLGQGKKVCLVYRSDWTRHLLDKNMPKPKYAFKATWNRFKPVIWDRGTNYGGLCDEKTLNKFGFPTGKFYDFNYGEISEDCDKIILDDFPTEVNSLVTGIDKSTRDRFDAYKSSFNLPEIMPDRCWRKFSYLFEIKVGDGSLLVCGFNLTGLNENDPSSVAMGNFIKNYIVSDDFAPKNEISLGELKTYMEKCSGKPVKERMMTQYWELDDAPVESKKYWEESRKYLERDD